MHNCGGLPILEQRYFSPPHAYQLFLPVHWHAPHWELCAAVGLPSLASSVRAHKWGSDFLPAPSAWPLSTVSWSWHLQPAVWGVKSWWCLLGCPGAQKASETRSRAVAWSAASRRKAKKVPGHLCIEANVSLVASTVPNSPSRNASAETQPGHDARQTVWVPRIKGSESVQCLWAESYAYKVHSLLYPEHSMFLTRILRWQQLYTSSPFFLKDWRASASLGAAGFLENVKPFSSLDDETQTASQVCTGCWFAQENWFGLICHRFCLLNLFVPRNLFS